MNTQLRSREAVSTREPTHAVRFLPAHRLTSRALGADWGKAKLGAAQS